MKYLGALSVLGLLASSAQAGTFEMYNVSTVIKANTNYYIGIEVQGFAQYVGPKDPDDNSYLIQTFLNDSYGGDLNDWNNPDEFGAGLTGTTVYETQVISCTGACAAYGNIVKPFCPDAAFYKGKGGVTIYHQFTPEIDIKYTAVYSTGCAYNDIGGGGGPPNPGCESGSATTTTTVTSIGSGATVSRGRSSGTVGRRDIQEEVRYLLEEWAVLDHQRAPGAQGIVDILNASSEEFARSVAAEIGADSGNVAEGPILVIEGIDHPYNDRYIPTPTVRLVGEPIMGGSPGDRLVLRADFAESGTLASLDVLHASSSVSAELVAAIEQHLALEYETAGRHRAVSFVVLELGGPARPVQMVASRTVLPLCCCYTDETGTYCI